MRGLITIIGLMVCLSGFSQQRTLELRNFDIATYESSILPLDTSMEDRLFSYTYEMEIERLEKTIQFNEYKRKSQLLVLCLNLGAGLMLSQKYTWPIGAQRVFTPIILGGTISFTFWKLWEFRKRKIKHQKSIT